MIEEKIAPQNTSNSKPVKHPWVIYFVALWSFFGIAGFVSTFIRVMTRASPVLNQLFNLVLFALIIAIIIYVMKMRRSAIISFGIACILLALYNLINIIFLLLSNGLTDEAIHLGIFYAIPSVILAAIVLRPSFLKLANQYQTYKKFESEQILALKKSLQ